MTVPAVIIDRWRTGQLTGQAKHQLVVRVRPGYVLRDYMARERIDAEGVPLGVRGIDFPLISPTIFGGNNHFPWQGIWTPTGGWLTLPNIQSAKHARSFDQNGSSSLTVQMDNVVFEESLGFAGVYHTITRGFFSPSRGVVLSSRPDLWDDTGWTDALNGGYQIELWEGYGPDGDPSVIPLVEADFLTHTCAPPDAAITRTWTGIIEDCDLDSHPDHITVTARDFGILFTDQRLQGTNKAAEILAPTTFADRRKTLGELTVVAELPPSKPRNLDQPKGVTVVTSQASSEFDTHGGLTGWVPISAGGSWWGETAFTPGYGWWSATQAAPSDVQWLEMNLPSGSYDQFAVRPHFEGMEVWVSIWVGPDGGRMDGAVLLAPGWVPLVGVGDTPDGTPYIQHWDTVPAPGETGFGQALELGHEFALPEGSRLRCTFGKLGFADPTYDTAPPFPYGFLDSLLTAGSGMFDIPSIRANIAAARVTVKELYGVLTRTRTELTNAHRFEFAGLGGTFYSWGHIDSSAWPTTLAPALLVADSTGTLAYPISDFQTRYDDAKLAYSDELDFLKSELAFLTQAIKENAQAAADNALAQQIQDAYSKLWLADSVANPGYYASVTDLRAYHLSPTPADVGQEVLDPTFSPVNAQQWVLVDDAADVIVMLCIWLGFKEWDIDPFGWSLVNPMQYGSDKFFIDVVNDILAEGNSVFFMGPPTDDDRSIGVPRFRRQGAVANPPANMLALSDADLLEAAQVKWDLSQLPGVLRYRGDPVPGADSGPGVAGGQTWEEDLVATYMANYAPPWAGDAYTPLTGRNVATANRIAGVIRHFTQTVGVNVVIGLASNQECLFACLLAAIQYALAMCTGQLQIPGRPGLELNDQIGVIDEADGINSRMWLASIESEHTMGQTGKWTMTLGGSFIDSSDMALVIADYWAAYAALPDVREMTPMIPIGQVGA